jgi:integrase
VLANGEAARETLPVFPTKGNITYAENLLKTIRREIADGSFEYAKHFPDSPRALAHERSDTFGTFCDLWLQSKGGHASTTLTQYTNAVEIWKTMFGESTPIRTLTHSKLAAAIGSQPWASPGLKNNYLICLRGAFKLAARDLKFDNPMDGIKNSRDQDPPPDPLSLEEMNRVTAEMRKSCDPRIWAYFEFAFMTGLRPEELIALRWKDVDWKHETLRVERAKVDGEIKPIKTFNVRDVDLVDRALAALETMKNWTYRPEEENWEEVEIFQSPTTGVAFANERSQRDNYWTPILKRLRIRRRRAYQTRHTYATTALMAGANPSYISRQLGHKSPEMVFKVYAKWIEGADRGREKAKVEASVGAAAGPVARNFSPEFPQRFRRASIKA